MTDKWKHPQGQLARISWDSYGGLNSLEMQQTLQIGSYHHKVESVAC